MSAGWAIVSGESKVCSKTGAVAVQKNYIHVSTMTIGDLLDLAAARGLMPSELLDGRFWLRRAASADEG